MHKSKSSAATRFEMNWIASACHDRNQPVEVVGRKLRKLMSWFNAKEVD